MTNRLLRRSLCAGRIVRPTGIIAAAGIGDVIDLIRGGCTVLPDDNNYGQRMTGS
jgi:hypothetical protein